VLNHAHSFTIKRVRLSAGARSYQLPNSHGSDYWATFDAMIVTATRKKDGELGFPADGTSAATTLKKVTEKFKRVLYAAKGDGVVTQRSF